MQDDDWPDYEPGWRDTIWLDLGYAGVCTLVTLAGLLCVPELAFRWLL